MRRGAPTGRGGLGPDDGKRAPAPIPPTLAFAKGDAWPPRPRSPLRLLPAQPACPRPMVSVPSGFRAVYRTGSVEDLPFCECKSMVASWRAIARPTAAFSRDHRARSAALPSSRMIPSLNDSSRPRQRARAPAWLPLRPSNRVERDDRSGPFSGRDAGARAEPGATDSADAPARDRQAPSRGGAPTALPSASVRSRSTTRTRRLSRCAHRCSCRRASAVSFTRRHA